MNETKTQTISHPTWTVTAYRKGTAWKVIAISPGRKHILHADKVTDADLADFDPVKRYFGEKAAPTIVDFVTEMDGAA